MNSKSEIQVHKDTPKYLKMPSWWRELTKFWELWSAQSDLSSFFQGSTQLPQMWLQHQAQHRHLAPKAVVHYEVNAGTRPPARAGIPHHMGAEPKIGVFPSVLIGFGTIINHSFWGITSVGNIQIYNKTLNQANHRHLRCLRKKKVTGSVPNSTGKRSRSYNATVRKWGINV